MVSSSMLKAFKNRKPLILVVIFMCCRVSQTDIRRHALCAEGITEMVFRRHEQSEAALLAVSGSFHQNQVILLLMEALAADSSMSNRD